MRVHKLTKFRRFLSKWQNWLGLILVAIFLFMAIAAPWLSPQDPDRPGAIKIIGNTIRNRQPLPPSVEAPLGTLSNQSSVYHSLVWGSRSAVVFGVIVALFSMTIGVLIGTLSAFSRRWINSLLMRITDAFLAFPMIAGVVMITQLATILLFNAGVQSFITGTGSMSTTMTQQLYFPENMPLWMEVLQKLDPLIVTFIMLSWMPYARIMNAVVNRLKSQEYIEAARTSGTRPSKIIFKHILPNAISPAIIMAARDVGGLVILQTTFSFIGLGGRSPWAYSLVTARDWIIGLGGKFDFWWVFLPITLAVILFGIGWNLVGDGLNDLLNPRSR
jgi:peptide/nickel transport system permease protein